MDWIQSVQSAVNYIEEHITEDLTPETVAKSVYSSNAHFQRIFSMITGITIGDYIRNRRLSLAGKELAESELKIIDVAQKYHYDSAASFTKAYLRFHGITPSESKKNGIFKSFAPLTIQIHIRGGFDMQRKIIHNIPVFPYDGNNAAFFVTLLEAVLRGIGEECDKPKLIALSGEGNRFCWDDKAWVFGNEVTESINETPFETENRVLSAIGWKAKYISVQHDRDGDFLNTDLAQIRRDFVDSIDRGFPVIIRYIRHDDCDLNVFFGYEDNGQRIIGYDYNALFHVGDDQTADNSTPTVWEGWENNLSGYILLGIKSIQHLNAVRHCQLFSVYLHTPVNPMRYAERRLALPHGNHFFIISSMTIFPSFLSVRYRIALSYIVMLSVKYMHGVKHFHITESWRMNSPNGRTGLKLLPTRLTDVLPMPDSSGAAAFHSTKRDTKNSVRWMRERFWLMRDARL